MLYEKIGWETNIAQGDSALCYINLLTNLFITYVALMAVLYVVHNEHTY